jgi:hypothetical protein
MNAMTFDPDIWNSSIHNINEVTGALQRGFEGQAMWNVVVP